MQSAHYQKEHNLAKLHDEILSQVEGFHRTFIDSEGEEACTADCGRLRSKGSDIWIEFADDLDPTLITQIIEQHSV